MLFAKAFLIIFLGLCMPAYAKDMELSFSVHIKRMKVGTLEIHSQQSGKNYKVSGLLKTVGFMKLISNVEYKAETIGKITGARFSPANYSEERKEKGNKTSASIAYKDETPEIRKYNPPREKDPKRIDASTQKGTIDPLTALYATLKDVNLKEMCKLELQLFDGKHKSRVKLSSFEKDGDLILCYGEYVRLAGFRPEQMAEKTRFPFNIFYEEISKNTFRIKKVIAETIHGTAVLKVK